MSQKIKPLSSTPPKKESLNKLEKLEEFISQANNPEKSGAYQTVSAYQKKVSFPWEDPYVREDLKKTFNLRLSEKDFKKLEYLSKVKKESMHEICMSILIAEINRQLKIV